MGKLGYFLLRNLAIFKINIVVRVVKARGLQGFVHIAEMRKQMHTDFVGETFCKATISLSGMEMNLGER